MSASETAFNRLRRMILESELPPRRRLPPERDLAADFGVSRGALRGALARLEEEGLIWRHVGRGTFVTSRVAAAASMAPAPTADDGSGETGPAAPPRLFRPDTTNPQEVMEARLILEPHLCGLAAHRSSPAQIAFMETCLAEGAAAEDIPTFERWDGALHRSIAEAAGNSLMAEVFRAIDSVRDQEIWGRLKRQSVTPERRRAYVRQHGAVVEAIRDRDAEAAKRLMREHLTAVRQNMLGSAGE
ncbi:FadR/GntR family transcriptional regulator [Caenispirillum salinarum]|uniref:FadR/GntR family transcriptional regulator n=1 Tax=Caenispirillum salinarum TaxID=859058 RepID=UPI00384CB19C